MAKEALSILSILLVGLFFFCCCGFVNAQSDDTVQFQDQVPTGADRAPSLGSGIRCAPWVVPGTQLKYFICMRIQRGTTGLLHFYSFQTNRWEEKRQITLLAPKLDISLFLLINNTIYGMQKAQCQQLFSYNLVTNQSAVIELSNVMPPEACTGSQVEAPFEYNDDIYFLAGLFGANVTGNLYKIDILSSSPSITLVPTSGIQVTRNGASAARRNDELFYYGGVFFTDDGSNTPFSVTSFEMDVLDLKTFTWSKRKDGDIKTIGGSMVYSPPPDDKLYLLGGLETLDGVATTQSRIHSYDPTDPNSDLIDISFDGGNEFQRIADRGAVETGFAAALFLALFRSEEGLFAVGSFEDNGRRRSSFYPGLAYDDHDVQDDYGLTSYSLSKRSGLDINDTTGGANQLAPIGYIFNIRKGAPYYTKSVETTQSILSMDGRNFQSVLKPTADAEVSLNIGFVTVTEYDAVSDKPVDDANNYRLPLRNFDITDFRNDGAYQEYYFRTTLLFRGENCTFELIYNFYEAAHTIESAGISFDVAPNDVKATIRITNWPFITQGNTLELRIDLGTTKEGAFRGRTFEYPSPGIVIVHYSWSKLKGTVRLLEMAEIDGVPAPVKLTYEEYGILVRFPYFQANMTYDPDFGATVDATGGDGSSDNQLVYLAFLSVLALVPVVIVIVVVAAIAFFVIKLYFKSDKSGDFDVDL